MQNLISKCSKLLKLVNHKDSQEINDGKWEELILIIYIPFTLTFISGEHYTQEFEKISPFRKVPVIVDGDFPLIERYVLD